MRSLPYYSAFIFPVLAVWGFGRGGAAMFLLPAAAFIVIPLLDLIVGADASNLSPERERSLAEARSFRVVTYLYAAVQLAFVLWTARVAAGRAFSALEWTGLVFSTGLVTGAIGITVAHELCHKPTRHEKALGQGLLMTVCYMHFALEHLVGHHARVSTPEDPTSSRRGESLYAFLPRTLIGSFRSVWAYESRRLRERDLPARLALNRVLWYVALPLSFAAALGAAFGPNSALFFFAQSAVAILLLESINYVEHYGLSRRRLPSGRYESVQPAHSWNSNHLVSNLILFRLQRHSDHHAHPLRRYQVLRHFDESPQLPQGYPAMLLLALAPPLWRAVMDHRAAQLRAH